MNEARLLKLPEVMERLAISRTAVYRLIDDGTLPTVHIGKRSIRFPSLAVEALIAGNAWGAHHGKAA